ncbi:uncharacterized protein AB675_8189 [Cyphellophora attinorum]|uniref:CFEM domain-containing protein n=1 Tax=Cyphellophora attinorum TaxID=1664694 RepID=A0A0N1HC46_9EURO|nr:uncharacterized protein AB675_8189 [Phialophora attinorum]KPI41217.1 hypothetical protein AB675_8189 [Phialophora attinorum]
MLFAVAVVLSLFVFTSSTVISTCSDTCFTGAFAKTDCSVRDSYCICSSEVFAAKFTDCLGESCSSEDPETLFKKIESFCEAVGGVEKRDAAPEANNNPPSWWKGGFRGGQSGSRWPWKPQPGDKTPWKPGNKWPWKPQPGQGQPPHNGGGWQPPKPPHNPTKPDGPHFPTKPHDPHHTAWYD